MNQHTPQEWADITGCYVAKRANLSLWTLYSEKPILKEGRWRCDLTAIVGDISPSLIEEPSDHDWTTLYEPRKADNAPHQSEVFIHKEYKVICADNQKELQDRVTLAMYEGWKPQGSVFVQDRSNTAHTEFAFYYQAMVRGI